MFIPGRWAKAFVNSLEKEGALFDEGITVLGILASWVKTLPGEVFGRSAAKKLEKLILSDRLQFVSSPVYETAVRFIVLMVRKNTIRHIDRVIDEIKKQVNKKNGILTIYAEYAFPPEGDFEQRIKEAVKTKAQRVEFSGKVNPDLIGGYKLRIGDRLIDASVRSQLLELGTLLAGTSFQSGGN